jgi:putative ABC transport system ATP-binding protein
MIPILSARGLVKSYGQTPALRGVTLDVGVGELVAITGPSGCGKSTLLHCLAGILRPDVGEVIYRRSRIDTLSEGRRSLLRRTDFGVLFQFGQLVAELSAADNVALPLLLGRAGRREARTAALTWLERLGVAEIANSRPGELSGGQQQRVALARALITEPSILFADEPTGALDTINGEQVMGQLIRVARAQQTAVLLVTHSPQIAAYADREISLRDGMIDSSGLGLPEVPKHAAPGAHAAPAGSTWPTTQPAQTR